MEFVIDCFSRKDGISVEKSINDLIEFEEKFKEIASSFKKKKSIPETDEYQKFINGKFKKKQDGGEMKCPVHNIEYQCVQKKR